MKTNEFVWNGKSYKTSISKDKLTKELLESMFIFPPLLEIKVGVTLYFDIECEMPICISFVENFKETIETPYYITRIK